jgi:hypothetical protein
MGVGATVHFARRKARVRFSRLGTRKLFRKNEQARTNPRSPARNSTEFAEQKSA